jgi:serine/threonine protein kinase
MNTPPENSCQKCGKPILEGSPRGLCPLCLMSAVAKSDEPLPDMPALELEDLRRAFPQLEIIEPLGAGGMGRVYKARQPHLDRFVALKVLPSAYAADPEWIERFTREARALARLNHPSIVQVYDFGEAVVPAPVAATPSSQIPTPSATSPITSPERIPFLLMEFVDGVNLRQALRTGALTAREALTIVPSVCAALQYAHDQGVLHRDIKPENILLDTQGRVKIADFGLAKLGGDGAKNVTLTATGAQLGTAAYMAPEQIEKPHDVDHRADIYSLGVVFYELLTGELPIGRFPAPSEKAGTDPRLDTIVFRTLEKERERRFQSATEMRTQVENVAQHPTPAPAPAREPKHTRAVRILVLLAVISCIGIPIAAMTQWVKPQTMVIFAILFGTLAAVWPRIFRDAGPRSPEPSDMAPRGTVALVFALVLLPLGIAAASTCVYLLLARAHGAFGLGPIEIIILGPLALLGYGLAIVVLTWLFRSLRRSGLSTAAASGAVAVLLAILPVGGCVAIVLLSHTERSAGLLPHLRSTPAEVVTSDRAPFVGRLPEGTVELVAISHYPAKGEPWWKMDGSPATAADSPSPEPDTTPQFGERVFIFHFRVNNLPKGTSLRDWEVANSTGWSVGEGLMLGTGSEPRLSGQGNVTARLPSSQRDTDIRVGIGFGEWTTIFEAGPQSVGGVSPSHEGVTWTLGWSSAIETKDGTIISNWNAPRERDWNTRVVAVKKDGATVATNDHSTGQNQTEWRFSGFPLADVRAFAFQVRRVQWVEFRGIKLAPNQPAVKSAAPAGTELQDQAIRLARERPESARIRFDAGTASEPEVAAAMRNLAVAEARGDATRIAAAHVAFAESHADFVRKAQQAGETGGDELNQAESALNAARQELERAKARADSSPP